MKQIQIAILAVCIGLLPGCKAPRLTWCETQDRFDAHRHETMNDMFYMGSDSTDHYFNHSFLTMYLTVYRVRKEELTIKNEVPLTKDRELWRKYKMPFRINVDNVEIVTSEQNLGQVSSEAAPSAPPDEPSS
jgi:hypothetical protein